MTVPMEPVSEDSSANLRLGIEQFNQGDYYACHDTIESIWMTAETVDKPFYQGILQIAVGLYHLSNLNWQGAAILMGEGTNRLYAYEPSHRGVDVTDLVSQALSWLEALQSIAPDQVDSLAAHLSALTAQMEVSSERWTLTVPHIGSASYDGE